MITPEEGNSVVAHCVHSLDLHSDLQTDFVMGHQAGGEDDTGIQFVGVRVTMFDEDPVGETVVIERSITNAELLCQRDFVMWCMGFLGFADALFEELMRDAPETLEALEIGSMTAQ